MRHAALSVALVLAITGIATADPFNPFAQHKDEIKTLTVEQAEALAKHESVVHLGSLTELTPEAAKALALQEGGWLRLNGLTTLSDEAAKALAQHEGGVGLEGLTTLSNEAVKALQANPEIQLPDKFKQ